MAKEDYYFPHDYNSRSDPKTEALIAEFKAEGYGIYWAIIEMLHKEETHWLPRKKYVYVAIAKQMLASAEQVEALLNYCINDCELFIEKDGFFTSKRVLKNFEKRAEISEKRSIAGKKGAIAKQNLANASKGKEKKRKENINKEEEVEEGEENSDSKKLEKIFTLYFSRPPSEGDKVLMNKFLIDFDVGKIEEAFQKARANLNHKINLGYIRGILNETGEKPKNGKSEGSVKTRLNYKFDPNRAKQTEETYKERYG